MYEENKEQYESVMKKLDEINLINIEEYTRRSIDAVNRWNYAHS